MSFVLSLCEIPSGEKFGEVYVKGEICHKYGKNLFIFKGEVCDMTNEEFLNKIRQKGVQIVEETKGEFFIIFYDIDLRKIYIANDRIGRETLFYFYDKNNLIISDDFWEIVNLIEPNTADIDVQTLKEFVVFSKFFSGKTIIKNLNFFPPASICEFSLMNRTFELKQYWDFRFQTDYTLSIDEAIERMDRALDNAIKQIKEKNNSNATYGIGLTGGLDTRLIAHYALKHKMRLKSFIIGEKSPHKIVLSRDHKSARKLAKYFNLEHYEVEYDSENFENKSFYDIRHAPMRVSTFFRIVRNDIPKFDVLLTGALGILVGDIIPKNIIQLSKEELLDTIILYSAASLNVPRRFIMLRKALKLIFGSRISTSPAMRRGCIKGIIDEREFAEGVNKIRKFIEENSDKSNIEIFLKYFIFHLGAEKYGAFESLCGWKKSYTVYYPFILDEILTWKPDYLINRKLLKCLIIKKFPELAKIKAQTAGAALFYRNKRFFTLRQMLAGIEYVIRGSGVERSAIWARKKRYMEYSLRILSRPNSIFESIFDVREIIQSVKSGNINTNLYENLIKIKQILDIIETKGYKKFTMN